jgi:Protein of unknown function (DUF1553)/Protein of unknown function (DUF1549)
MAHKHYWFGGLILAVASQSLHAVPPPAPPADGLALAARIDQHIGARLAVEKIPPAPLADDAEFLRRVYLDLSGRIPLTGQVYQFLRDRAPDKRQRVINRLLDEGGYARHFTNVWRAVLLPDNAAGNNGALRAGFEAWLWKQLTENTSYDQMIREIIKPGGPRAFYQARENKPENLAAATSRLFLGVKLECAQCHRHPFAPWTREQFWGLAAFYSGLPQPRQPGMAVRPQTQPTGHEIRIPGTDKVVQARFPNGKEPTWTDGTDPRTTLADWVTAPDNPYFARAAVNRVWSHFFGTGLVDPVDDLGDQNPASHPELLDELARQFAEHHFDLKFLIRAITNSQAYQRTSRVSHPGQEDPRRFARMALKGLTPEQLFDSLAQATGYEEPAGGRGQPGRLRSRAEFLTRFANPGGKITELRLSILQALALMNGKLVADATDLEDSVILAAILETPWLDTKGRVQALFLTTLGRLPHPEESGRLVKYVDRAEADVGERKALADVFWALLNSGEFILNH